MICEVFPKWQIDIESEACGLKLGVEAAWGRAEGGEYHDVKKVFLMVHTIQGNRPLFSLSLIFLSISSCMTLPFFPLLLFPSLFG